MLKAKQDIVMLKWYSFLYIICDKTQIYYCNAQLRLLYDTNNKCTATNVLATLIF